MNWTQQQSSAILGRGGSILVSAGAGSGKTYVIVQRLLSYITDPDDPRDIDDFLIITYTRAAASELKQKIFDELSNRLSSEPSNYRIRRQLLKIHSAKICTVHSFCASVLREHAARLDLDASFRIPDEAQSSAMLDRILDRLLDERYEQGDSDFHFLADTIGNGRDDSGLHSAVLKLYRTIQSLPSPSQWLEEQKESLRKCGETDPLQTPWGKYFLDEAVSYASLVARRINETLDIMSSCPDIYDKYSPAFIEDLGNFSSFLSAASDAVSWDGIREASRFGFSSFKSVRNASDPVLKSQVSDVRKAYKAKWSDIVRVFDISSQEVRSDSSSVARALIQLVGLVLDLSTRYDSEKRSKGLLDYSDLEHSTYDLLQRDGSADEIGSRFAEVLVDEYQDTNEIQDRIFTLLSGGGKRLFMVGDVKQSIYRFRMAEPAIFLSRYDSCSPYSSDTSELRRVDLNANFRSDPNILSFVNGIFRTLMSRRLGGVDYTADAELRSLSEDVHDRVCSHVTVIDTKDLTDSDGSPVPHEKAEAMFVARKIYELLKSGTTVVQKDGVQLPLSPGDIAILLRSDRSSAAVYSQALSLYGIPSTGSVAKDMFSSQEIQVLVSLLRIIDNPRQDVPLITVMHSPLYGFTADDLAGIRLSGKEMSMYDALVKAAETSEKCRDFIDCLNRFREESLTLSCSELIWSIFTSTGIRELYSSMEDGRDRRRNLDALYEYAVKCAEHNSSDLFSFLLALEEAVKNDSVPGPKADDSPDSVKIMTIHRSKGLEFPVVFLSSSALRFNRKDVDSSLLIDKKLGVAARYVDNDKMYSIDTVPRAAIRSSILSQQLSEEARILYVALTRAKSYLHITMSGSRMHSMVLKCGMLLPPDSELLRSVGSMAEWVLLCLLSRESLEDLEKLTQGGTLSRDTYTVSYTNGADYLIVPSPKRGQMPSDGPAPSHAEDVSRVLEWKYPFPLSHNIPSKLTATQLRLSGEDDDSMDFLPAPADDEVFDRPRFITEQTGLTAGERGTAVHLVMQYIDFSKCGSIEGIRSEIERLTVLEQLTPEQAAAVDPGRIHRFFTTDIGRLITGGAELLREFKFSILCPASEYYPDAPKEDSILLQGVVDACIDIGDRLIVLDFKTDRVNHQTQPDRAAHYAVQLRTYAAALRRITGKPVSKMLLYFFSTGTFSVIDL